MVLSSLYFLAGIIVSPLFCRFYRLTINYPCPGFFMPCARFSNLPDLTFHQSSAKDRFSSITWSNQIHFSRGESHWTAWTINPLLWKCKRPHSPPLWSAIFLGDLFFLPWEFVFDYLPFRITQTSRVFFIQTLILAQYFYCCFVFRPSLRRRPGRSLLFKPQTMAKKEARNFKKHIYTITQDLILSHWSGDRMV